MAQPLFLKFLHLRKKRRSDIDQFKMEAMPGAPPNTIGWRETRMLEIGNRPFGDFVDAEGNSQPNWEKINQIWRTTHELMRSEGEIPPLPSEEELFDPVLPRYLQLRFRHAAELYHLFSQVEDWKSHPRIDEFAYVIHWMNKEQMEGERRRYSLANSKLEVTYSTTKVLSILCGDFLEFVRAQGLMKRCVADGCYNLFVSKGSGSYKKEFCSNPCRDKIKNHRMYLRRKDRLRRAS